jgi:hypothetical protein
MEIVMERFRAKKCLELKTAGHRVYISADHYGGHHA